jgi:hypothetical protein
MRLAIKDDKTRLLAITGRTLPLELPSQSGRLTTGFAQTDRVQVRRPYAQLDRAHLDAFFENAVV